MEVSWTIVPPLSDDVGDHLGQLPEGQVLANSDIDRLGTVIVIEQEQGRRREIIDVQELSGVSPTARPHRRHCSSRRLWHKWLALHRAQGLMSSSVLVAGDLEHVAGLVQALNSVPEAGHKVVAACSDDADQGYVGSVPVLGGLSGSRGR